MGRPGRPQLWAQAYFALGDEATVATGAEYLRDYYGFTGGYVLGREPGSGDGREELRERFGYGSDEVVCVATVGGSGVGAALLGRLSAAAPYLAPPPTVAPGNLEIDRTEPVRTAPR